MTKNILSGIQNCCGSKTAITELSNIIRDVNYDADTNSIVITFVTSSGLKPISISLDGKFDGDIEISQWTVNNDENSPIELSLNEDTDPKELSSSVKISEDEDNILTVNGGKLEVIRPTAQTIKYDEAKTVYEFLSNLNKLVYKNDFTVINEVLFLGEQTGTWEGISYKNNFFINSDNALELGEVSI